MRDPYSILGIRRDADADEIKSAWRSKAKNEHPDKNRDDPTAGQRFAELGQAYDVLKDPQKRQRYDQQAAKMDAMKRQQTILQQREEARAAAERAKQAKANADRIMAELQRVEAEKQKAEKAAESLMAKAEAAKAQAADAEAKASRAQASSAQNTSAQSQTQSQAQQNSANQAKHKPESKQEAAGETASGQTEEALNKIFGAEEPPKTEEKTGFLLPGLQLITSLVRLIRKPQPVLEKAPDITVEATIALEDLLQKNTISVQLSDGRELKVPLEAGLTDGSLVRLAGKGIKLPGLQAGDVVVTLRVLKSGNFTVDGYDIRTHFAVKLEDAVLGCEAEVMGPNGLIPVTIPAWSGSDQSIRLEGHGLNSGPNEKGALIVELRVLLWEKPDPKVTDLMKVMKHGLYL